MQRSRIDTPAPVPQRAPSGDEVRDELERIRSSPSFPASERRRAFLRFIVEETLSGRADRLKGYTVAVAVFGRGETFDAQADPVVRLEARRLRRDLDSYYIDAGSSDPVRISIPKGSYVPRFEWQEAMQSPAAHTARRATSADDAATEGDPGVLTAGARISRGRRLRVITAALLALVVAIAAASWAWTGRWHQAGTGHAVGEPALVVLPFEAMNSTEDGRFLADGISQELIRNLMRFPGFRLYTLPIGVDGRASAEPMKLGHDLGVAYVVSGSVRTEAEDVHVAVQLFEAATGQVLWSETYDRPLTAEALINVQSDLAGQISTVIGPPYGVVNSNLNLRLKTPAVSGMQSYVCVLRAYSYRRSFSRAEFGPILGCLEEAVRRDPNYSEAWAMLGWLHLDAGRYEFTGDTNPQPEYEKALEAASRAVQLEPHNVLALKALSAIEHYMGHYDEAERLAREAVDLNPYDPDTLAQYGWRLAVRGKFDEGIPLLKRAIERTANPPGWYFHLVAIDLYLKGGYEQMLQVAERSAVNGSSVSQALIAIANGALGHRDAAREALGKMTVFEPLARDPAAYFRRHGATDQIVDALMAGLRKAQEVASKS